MCLLPTVEPVDDVGENGTAAAEGAEDRVGCDDDAEMGPRVLRPQLRELRRALLALCVTSLSVTARENHVP